MTDRKRAWKRVWVAGFRVASCFLILTLWMVFLLGISVEYLHSRVLVSIFGAVAMTGLAGFVLGEVVIVSLTRAYLAPREKFPALHEAVERLWPQSWINPAPRLYILQQMKEPNACAFGMGFPYLRGIGISESLYALLSAEQLEAVIAHEIAHIRCLDVGLMTTIAVITGGAESLAKWIGQSVVRGTPAAWLPMILLYVFGKVAAPIGRSAISQERETAADALAAIYVNSPDPLIQALRSLSGGSDKEEDLRLGVLDGLLISHPKMEDRLRALEGLRAQAEPVKA